MMLRLCALLPKLWLRQSLGVDVLFHLLVHSDCHLEWLRQRLNAISHRTIAPLTELKVEAPRGPAAGGEALKIRRTPQESRA